jgi:glycine betaine/proline transport system ATP-binding protein
LPTVVFDKVDVVFGSDPKAALELLDQGEGRDSIQDKTGNVVAVDGVSLNVEAGEVCVVMGLSGSGKSTLLRCVNGLNKITRGRVLVHDEDTDVDIAGCDTATLRRLRMNRISMVFQQFALMPWRTIRDNVAFGLEIRGTSAADCRRVAEEKLALVGLDKWMDMYPHELSGGMQQRVGLARAFATDADILLMDEPFSALDPLIRHHLQDELLELQRRLNKTILFVSHDLDEALKLGSHVAIMESGRIVQFGSPEDIVLRPANEYVRQFVANMNPLNVLRGASIMRPVESLERDPASPDTVWLDPAGELRCRLDREGRPEAVIVNGVEGHFIPHNEGLDLDSLKGGEVVTGTLDTPMRTAIEVYHAVGRPLPLLGQDGRLLGVVGNREIFRGMLLRTSVASDRAASDTGEEGGEEPAPGLVEQAAR